MQIRKRAKHVQNNEADQPDLAGWSLHTRFHSTEFALQNYFSKYISQTDAEVESICAGTTVTKAIPSRSPAEIYRVWGRVHKCCARNLHSIRDFARLREIPGFLAVGVFSSYEVHLANGYM